jgi:hypothetical protein
MTTKMGVKGITCAFRAGFLCLLLGPSLVIAQTYGTVCFHKDPFECDAPSACCNVQSSQCCTAPLGYGWSASIFTDDGLGRAAVYKDTGCTNYYDGNNNGGGCWNGQCDAFLASGLWIAPGGSLGSEKRCHKTVSVDHLRYTFITKDERRAHWVLTLKGLTETDWNGPSIDLTAEEKLKWFTYRGATLMVEDPQTTAVLNYNVSSSATGPTLPHPLHCQST